MNGGIDEGPCFFYWRLSYRRKFIRSLWTLPLGIIGMWVSWLILAAIVEGAELRFGPDEFLEANKHIVRWTFWLVLSCSCLSPIHTICALVRWQAEKNK